MFMDEYLTNFDNLRMDKVGTELLLALNTSEEIREDSLDLNDGYEKQRDSWSLILRYNGNLDALANGIGFRYIGLLEQYAVIEIATNKIPNLIQAEEILYIEKPKKLYEEIILNRKDIQESCFFYPGISNSEYIPFDERSNVQEKNPYVLVAVIDSGIDIYHPQFIDTNGKSKIVCLWNQREGIYKDTKGNVPAPYGFGREFNKSDIDSLIEGNPIRPSYNYDPTGHGTAVASILCDLIPDSHLLVVSVLNDTLALMCAIDFAVRYALARNLPMVLNLSYGNNYGDHAGNSILETYIDSVIKLGKFSFVTGMGNDGNTGRHTMTSIQARQSVQIDLRIQSGVNAFNIQLWSENIDYTIQVIPPSQLSGVNQVNIQYGMPTPYNVLKENFIAVTAEDTYVQSGIWSLRLENKTNQAVDIWLWLPVAASTSGEVAFLNPYREGTFTIPASSQNVISVGAFDVSNQLIPVFSGKGYSINGQVKPDVVAPGVDIKVANVGGGTILVTGTSFAVPFVSSAAYYLMKKGIVEGYDPFLYGQRVKAYIQNGAKTVPGYGEYPNPISGYGQLCIGESLNYI